jgi:hypothetical protein
MQAGSSFFQERPGLVVRERHCHLNLEKGAAAAERLASYLALVDRPLAALLARDRLRRIRTGHFTYSSRPFRLLRFELVPSLALDGHWEEEELWIRSADCRIEGLGRWERALAFDLQAQLRPVADGLDGWARVSLALPPTLPGWSHPLAGIALEQVLERIERRLHRGLRKDLLTWLLDPAVSG